MLLKNGHFLASVKICTVRFSGKATNTCFMPKVVNSFKYNDSLTRIYDMPREGDDEPS